VDRADRPFPLTLRGAIALLVLQAASLVALLVLVAVGASGKVFDATILPFEILALVFAAMLVGLAWQLARRRAWARSPAVTLQLLFMPFAYYLIHVGVAWAGIPVLVSALVCVVLVVAPSSRAALGIRS
jgi:hypothetical protein